MPRIYLTTDSASGVKYINWTEPNGRSKRISTRTRIEAEAQRRLAEFILNEAEADKDEQRGAPIATLWAEYTAQHRVVSAQTTAECWKKLGPHFGDKLVTEINQALVDSYVKLRKAGKIGRPAVDSTCRRELAQLTACLGHHDLKAKFKLPKAGAPRDRWLRTEEVRKLMQKAANMRTTPTRLSRVERFLWLALETAGRAGALFDLTWDRVDFETNVIHLDNPDREKTKKRRASVPMSKNLRAIMDRAYKERGDSRHVVGGVTVIKAVKRVAKAADVPGVTPNVLRHTAATHMARKGVPLWIIAKVLGNSLVMVEKVYAKHCPEDLRSAVDLISAGFEHTGEAA